MALADFRWDVPLKKFGKELEEIQPGELLFSDENLIIGILLTSNAVVDVFDVAFGRIHEIWFDDLNKIRQTIDFHFGGEYWDEDDTEGSKNIVFKVENSLKLIYTPKLLKIAEEKNHIHNIKYLYENEVVNIRVYCPIKYAEATTFLDQWYEKLKKIRNAKRNKR